MSVRRTCIFARPATNSPGAILPHTAQTRSPPRSHLVSLCAGPHACRPPCPATAPARQSALRATHRTADRSTAACRPASRRDSHNPAQPTGPEFTDADRSAITLTAYDLDVRLAPATSALTARARVTLRNNSPQPLARIALQISSTLHWDSATLIDGAQRISLPLSQHLLDTDTDHTGKSSEAIVTLPQPLAAGATLTLDTFYSGTIVQNADRLERIGATAEQGTEADWDQIAALRGFGNVLWYPIAGPQIFLGQGAELFQTIGRTKLANENVPMHLRLAVEYKSDPPVAAYFCGRGQPLHALPDDPDAPIAAGSGVATADFPVQLIGFRIPSLFLFDHAEALLAPLPVASSSSSSSSSTPVSTLEPTGAPMLAAETAEDKILPRLAASAESIAPLIEHWFGAPPLSALTVLDHAGQPFEDGPFLVAPIATLAASDAATALAHSMTHAWVETGQPWMDEGLAQFAALLWVEQSRGRDRAIAELNDLLQPLILAEPIVPERTAQPATTPLPPPAGEPLITATSELYYRRKSVAVWFMLRGIAGEDALRETLAAWRTQPASQASARDQALALEKLLEQSSSKDLAWFFRDWVLNDQGLPDLSLADVTTRDLSPDAKRQSGWLVSVTARNDGGAAAEVPIIIRSGTFSTTRRLLIPAYGQATDRVLVEAAPTQVLLNDGTTPEVRTPLHQRDIVVKPGWILRRAIPRQSQPTELPPRPRREKIPVRRTDVRLWRYTRSTPQHHLRAHEFPVVFP